MLYNDFEKEDFESKKLFAEYLKAKGLVLREDVILECVRNSKYSIALEKCFHNNNKIIFCNRLPKPDKFKKCFLDNYSWHDSEFNYISNAFNDHVARIVDNLIPYCYFNLGVCTSVEDEYEYGKMTIVKYEDELLARGIAVEHFEEDLEKNNKIYVLSNRRQINVKR